MENDATDELDKLRRHLATMWPADIIEFAVTQYERRQAAEDEIRRVKAMTENFYAYISKYPLEPQEPQGPRAALSGAQRLRLASGDA